MKFNKTLIMAAMAMTSLLSCKKDKDKTCNKTLTGLAGTYTLLSAEYKLTATSTPVDLKATMDACEKDDLITLNANGTWIYKDAGTVCSPAGNDNGTWSVSNDIITSDGVVSGKIQSYDCNKLVCVMQNVTLPGDQITQVLRKQ